MPASTPIAIALVAAAVMGMAIQRGATCMVAAVDEAIVRRRYRRAAALAEAAVWVGGLVAFAQMFGVMRAPTDSYPLGALTIVGGMLLGLGAWINGACVFGAVARIGSGQWAYVATPIGFYLGCLTPLPGPDAMPGKPLPYAILLVALFGLFLVWRLVEAARAPDAFSHLWHPHRATLLIAITFVIAMLAVGPWAYTDALAAAAHGRDAQLGVRGGMVAALLGGAILGGLIDGKIRWQPIRAAALLRSLTGGAVMGLGGMIVPGGNDGLIMVGLPLLRPYAWAAVTVMTGTIAGAIGLELAGKRAGAVVIG